MQLLCLQGVWLIICAIFSEILIMKTKLKITVGGIKNLCGQFSSIAIEKS